MNKALGQLADRAHNSGNNAFTVRNKFKEFPTLRNAESKGNHEGRACAYTDAHEIMKAELRRLMNKFQNGALTMDDFGVDP